MLKNDLIIGPLSSYATAVLQKGFSSVKNGRSGPVSSRAMLKGVIAPRGREREMQLHDLHSTARSQLGRARSPSISLHLPSLRHGVASDQRLRSFSGALPRSSLPSFPSLPPLSPSFRDDSSFCPFEMRVRHFLPPPRHVLIASI